jgi:hypothetical protein
LYIPIRTVKNNTFNVRYCNSRYLALSTLSLLPHYLYRRLLAVRRNILQFQSAYHILTQSVILSSLGLSKYITFAQCLFLVNSQKPTDFAIQARFTICQFPLMLNSATRKMPISQKLKGMLNRYSSAASAD